MIVKSENWVGVLPFVIEVTLAILQDSRKLPEVKRTQKILANLEEIKSAVFLKIKETYCLDLNHH